MLKRFSMLFFVIVLALTVAGPAAASGDAPEHGGMGGVVPPISKAKLADNMVYRPLLYHHNGKTMRTNTTYAIYWIPAGYTVDTNYMPAINSFFQDVAHDSGRATNVYFASTQYFSNPGAVHIKYKSTFAGSVVDANPFPASGCALYLSVTNCLTDAQISAEIQAVIAANGWTAGPTKEFFLFTPDNVGSCFDAGGSSCAYTDYCAYHSFVGSVIYANQPYTFSYPSDCGINNFVASSPNGFAADSTINVVSHEHNESITDPRLNAWFDALGNENGDKCAWTFGAPIHTHNFNQTINGHHYILQREWSNYLHHGCVLRNK